MNDPLDVLTGQILDEEVLLGLRDVCSLCGVHAEYVIEMVEEGIAEPLGRSPREWRFTGPMVDRLQRALRLQSQLGVNLAGAALALDLLDELDELRRALCRAGA